MRRLRLVSALCLVLAVAALAVGMLAAQSREDALVGAMSPAAVARRVITEEVDSPLQLRLGGLDVTLTGPLACDRGQAWEITAELTQDDVAGRGRNDGMCKGDDPLEWTVRATSDTDDEVFATGAARACATLVLRRDGTETDTKDWCNDVQLVVAGRDGRVGSTRVVAWAAAATGALALVAAVTALVSLRRGAGLPGA